MIGDGEGVSKGRQELRTQNSELGNVFRWGSIINEVRTFWIICSLLISSVALAQAGPVWVEFLPNTKTLVAGQQAVVAVVMDIKEGFQGGVSCAVA